MSKKIIFLLIGICLISFVYAAPLIDFTSPTLPNAALTTNIFVEINVSITEENLDEIKYNWNGTNYSYYDDGLILMMNFDNVSALGENDTHTVDLSKYGNNGTVNGNVWNSSGKYGGAYEFNVSDGYIMVPDSEIFDTGNQITTSAWIKTDFSNQSAIGIVLHDNSRYKWLLYFTGGDTSDRVKFYINSTSGVKSAECDYAEGAVADNQWHLLTGTYDRALSSERIKMYYDGVECGTADGYNEPITEGDEGVWIGRWGSKSFNGSIDEVRIWNRSLNASEVYQQYVSNLNKVNLTNWNLYVNQSKNATSGLDGGDYTYFVSAKDDSGNENITTTRTLTIETIPPSINLDWIYPTANINVSQNEFFNVSANISCSGGNCGEINVTLDPTSDGNITVYAEDVKYGTTYFTTGSKWDGYIVANLNTYHSAAKFNVSGLPKGAIITDIEFHALPNTCTANHDLDIYAMTNDPVTSTYTTLWADACDGTMYVEDDKSLDSSSGCSNTVWSTIDLGASAVSDLQDAIDSPSWWAIGFSSNTTSWGYFYGHDSSGQEPYIIINYSTSKGIISTDPTETPFYTNTTNPYNLTLNEGGSRVITWWVNATGSIKTPFEFFVYANITSNLSLGAITSKLNITIKDVVNPVINITYPLNTSYNFNLSQINYTYSDFNGGGYCWYSNNSGVWNSSLVSAETNFEDVKTINGNNNFIVYCNDSSGNLGNSSEVSFFKDSIYPVFSDYWSNTATMNGSGLAIFNITILNTNGTVWLEINGTNYTANNISANTWNYSLILINETYPYKWHSWGNYSLTNFNSSSSLSYTLYGTLKIINISAFNETGFTNVEIPQGTNVTINVSAEHATSVFVKIWKTFIGGLILFQDYLSNTVGNLWEIDISTNSSWNVIETNYTVYANDSLDNQHNMSASFNVSDTTAPVIYLKSPANNTFTSKASNYFVANFTENVELANSTFYIWNSTNSLVNHTIIIVNGTYNQTNISFTFPYNDEFKWNYYSCDWTNNCAWNSTNFTLTYDNILPSINIIYPESTTYNINVSKINYTYSDFNGGGYCWYSNDSGVWNSSLVSAGTNFTGIISLEGTNNWTVYCNDSSGNIGSNSVEFIKDTPSIGLTLITPTGNINVSQNQIFSVSVNVSCSNANCGEINVSLDPEGEDSATCGSDCNLCNENYVTDSCEVGGVLADCGTSGTDGHFFVNDIWVNGTFSPGGAITIVGELDSAYTGSMLVSGWQNGIKINEFGCYDSTDSYICPSGTYSTLNFADNRCNLSFGAGYTGSETASFGADTIINESASIGSDYHLRVTFVYNAQCDVVGIGNGYSEFDGDFCEESSYGENDGINLTLTPNSKSGIISTIPGTIPFYTTIQNPYNLTLSEGESEVITWNVNATGEIDKTHEFFVFANKTAEMGYGNITEKWNITISNKDTTGPSISFVSPTNNSFSSDTKLDIDLTISDPILDSCWYSADGGTNISLGTGGSCSDITDVTWSSGTHIVIVGANDTNANNGSASVSFTIDTTNPTIDYSAETENDNSLINRNNIYIKVSATESNEKNISFNLYNSSEDSVNTTIYTHGAREINWTGLDDGSYKFNVSIYDNASNSASTATRSVRIDTTKPLISIISPLAQTYTDSSREFEISSNENLSYCLVSIDDWVTNNSMGLNSSLTGASYNSSINDGSYTARYWCNDTSGNINNTESVSFSVDATGPLISYGGDTEENNAKLTRNNIFVNVSVIETNEQNITFNLYYSNDTILNSTVYTDATHIINWTGLSGGGYKFNVTIYDNSSNVNSTLTRSVSIDTVVPSIVINSPSAQTYTEASVNFEISSNENLSLCIVSINNWVTNYSMDLNSSLTGASYSRELSDGNYNLGVWCNDAFGNVNNSELVSFSIDTTNPVVNINHPADNQYFNYNESININYGISTEDTDSCWYYLDDGASQIITDCMNLSLNLSEGNHLIEIWINDSANLKGSDNVNFTIDLTKPVVSLINPENNALNDSTNYIDFYYNISDTNSIINCSLIIDGVINSSVISPEKDQINNITIYLLNGDYNWNINCTDIANNINSSEIRTLILNYSTIVDDYGFDNSSTNFVDRINNSELRNVTNLTFEKIDYGNINFLEDVDLSNDIENNVLNFTKYINISFNRIFVNSSSLTALNTLAKLRLYNLTFSNPQILRDEVVCSDCIEESYVNNTLTFNVTGFSIYSTRETPMDTPAPSGGNNGGGGGGGSVIYECEEMSDCKSDYNCYEHRCVKLFDVEILSLNPIIESLNFSFGYLIKGMADFNGDVVINFWVERNGEKIELGQDVVYFGSFEEKTKTTNLIFPYYIGNGDYELYVQAKFENYQAESFRNLNLDISDEEKEIAKQEIGLSETIGSRAYLWILLLFIVLIAIIIILKLLIRLKQLGLSEMRFRARERMYWARQRAGRVKEKFRGFGKRLRRDNKKIGVGQRITKIPTDPYGGDDVEYESKKTIEDPYRDVDVEGLDKRTTDPYRDAYIGEEGNKNVEDPYRDINLEKVGNPKDESQEFTRGMNEVRRGIVEVKKGVKDVGQRIGQKLGVRVGKIVGYFGRLWEKDVDISSSYLKKLLKEKERKIMNEKRIKNSEIIKKRIRKEEPVNVWNQMRQKQSFEKNLEEVNKTDKEKETQIPLKLNKEEEIAKSPSLVKDYVGEKVYNSSGNQLGYVKKTILGKNEIYGWVIALDKKQGFKDNLLIRKENINIKNKMFIVNGIIENYLDKIKEKKEHIDFWKGHEIDENKRYKWRFGKNHWERKDK